MSAVPTRVPATPHAALETQIWSSQSRLLAHPVIPFLPLLVVQTHSFALVPHQLSLTILPCLQPTATTSVPACFTHQANKRLVLCPLLLFGDAGEVCCAIATGLRCEGDANAVGADGPVVGITGGRGEVCEQCHMDRELWQERSRYGREASVFEGAVGVLAARLLPRSSPWLLTW